MSKALFRVASLSKLLNTEARKESILVSSSSLLQYEMENDSAFNSSSFIE